jgi:lysozyme
MITRIGSTPISTVLLLVLGAGIAACHAPGQNDEGHAGMGAGPSTLQPTAAPPPPAVVCPDGATTEGIDVSYYQGSISWNTVAASGIEFAFIRVSDGLDYPDSRYQENWSGAQDAGVIRGTYQYFRVGQDATAQAEYLLDQMGSLEEGDLPPVIDVENYGNEGYSSNEVTDAVGEWISVIEDELGVPPIIYTSYGAWSSMSGSSDFRDYPLWAANWHAACPLIPDQWSDWYFWQYSATGSVAGISGDVDLDVFNGDLSALEDFTWAGGGEDPPPEDDCCAVAADGTVVAQEDGDCAVLSSWGSDFDDIDGHGGHAYLVEVDEPEPDYGEGITYCFDFAQRGEWEIWAWIPDGVSNLATDSIYKIWTDDDQRYVYLDQAAGQGGWALLDDVSVGSGELQVRTGDNYRDASQAGRNVVFDALRVAPPGGSDTGSPQGCDCDEPGASQTADCPDGGYRYRTCDGCDWSAWSECPEGWEDSGEPNLIFVDEGCGCGSAGSSDARWALPWVLVALGVLRRPRGPKRQGDR